MSRGVIWGMNVDTLIRTEWMEYSLYSKCRQVLHISGQSTTILKPESFGDSGGHFAY